MYGRDKVYKEFPVKGNCTRRKPISRITEDVIGTWVRVVDEDFPAFPEVRGQVGIITGSESAAELADIYFPMLRRSYELRLEYFAPSERVCEIFMKNGNIKSSSSCTGCKIKWLCEL
jgi:hypothetical protein